MKLLPVFLMINDTGNVVYNFKMTFGARGWVHLGRQVKGQAWESSLWCLGSRVEVVMAEEEPTTHNCYQTTISITAVRFHKT